MSVTDQEYAILSNAVYRDENYIDPANYGFEFVDKLSKDETGFSCELFRRGNDLVMAFRGSDNMLNYYHDLSWVAGAGAPPEFGTAMKFYERAKEYAAANGLTISMTGHSLGGSAVQYVNATIVQSEGRQWPGVTFAVAGVGGLFPGTDPSSIAVKNYIRNGDAVPENMNEVVY